ncbi:MAG TPA: hypothetical protein VGC79_15510 [Polyangiaceae bacterium]
MKDKFITHWFYSPIASYEGGGSMDYDDYCARLKRIYNDFDAAGYEVINVLPIEMSRTVDRRDTQSGWMASVGYSPTRGAVIVGKLKEV